MTIVSEIKQYDSLDFQALYPMGIAFLENKEFQQSLSVFLECKKLQPTNSQIYNMLGIAYQETGNPQKAIECFTQAIFLSRDNLNPLCNLIRSLYMSEEDDLALFFCKFGLELFPNELKLIAFQADLCLRQGLWSLAYQCYATLVPAFPQLAQVAGTCALKIEKTKEAYAFLQQALAFDPENEITINNLANYYGKHGNLTKALEYYSKAISINPNIPTIYSNLSRLYALLGMQDQAWKYIQIALSKNIEDNYDVYQNYLFLLLSRPHLSSEFLLSEHQRIAQTIKGSPRKSYYRPSYPLRIGIVSGNLRNHSSAFFLHNILQFHNPEKVEIYSYNNTPINDLFTTILNKHTKVTPTLELTTSQTCSEIDKDKIQILIDLDGYTNFNRLDIFACKPAPIQISFLGYPHTTGLSTIDYRIADVLTDPIDCINAADHVLYLTPSFLSYSPLVITPPVARSPFETNGFITFGSFNAPRKLNMDVFLLWANLLQSCPNSKLIMKYMNFNNDEAIQEIHRFFSEQGIVETRIQFPDAPLSHLKHLATYSMIDVALDPFPYNGTTTTCEALWMGVPTITLIGNEHRSRTSYSILKNAGLKEFCAKTPEDYIRIAENCCQQPEKIIGLRKVLRAQFQNSPVMDGVRYTANFENTLLNLFASKI